MEPTYDYKFKFYFTWIKDGVRKTVCEQRFHENNNDMLKQIEAYNKIKLELAKTYGEVDWFLVKDFVKRDIMAWSLEQRLLDPVKDYVENCRRLVSYWNDNTFCEGADLCRVEVIKSITIYEETVIDIPKTSEENKVIKTC